MHTPTHIAPTHRGFTLVELIVVITILAILGTIGFLSFDKYTTQSRDAVRTEDIGNIRKGLDAYEAAHGKYPMPDNAVAITATGITVRYQGYVGKQVLSNIKFSSNAGTDPLDGTYYTYATNAIQTKAELLAYLEDGSSLALNNLNPLSAYADLSDYSKRFPLLSGHPIGIIVSAGTLVPVQVAASPVEIATTNTGYVAYVSRGSTVSGTGAALVAILTGSVTATGTSGTNVGALYCGSSTGQLVGAPTAATFSGNLCASGATVSTWSGTGGANGTLSWTCQNGTSYSNCTANYNKFTTTTTSTMAGAACDTYDLLVGNLTSSYQVWSACNVGASVAYMGTAITNCGGGGSDCDSAIRNTLGYYFQWGRSDDVTSGALQGAAYNGTLTSNSTSNQLFYPGTTNYDWYLPEDGSSTPTRWNTVNQ